LETKKPADDHGMEYLYPEKNVKHAHVEFAEVIVHLTASTELNKGIKSRQKQA
jgi:hypothetical protein